MARKRMHGVDLPRHVHRVKAKGKEYYFYQVHRGTDRAGDRIPLPSDPTTAEFWTQVRELAGVVPGYSGTVAAMIDAYLASPEYEALARSSKRVYRLYLRQAQSNIGQHKPDAIRPAHILALRDKYKATKSAANTMIKALSAVYIWGRPRDYAINNPCQRIPLFEGGEHKPWTPEIIQLVMDNARWEIIRFVTLTLATGQREGDVCAMSLADIKDDSVRVIQEKTGKEIWIPLPADARLIVQECRRAGTLHLISKPNGEPYTAAQLRSMWTRELGKTALSYVRQSGFKLHGLCKNAHNELFEAGNNESEVQAVTGRSAQMVRHYAKARDQRVIAKRAGTRRDEYRASKVLQTASKG
jgi:integrase